MSLYLNRYGETSHLLHSRGERVYSIDAEWYFSIRRGYDLGPYETENEARQALISFVQEQLDFEKD